MTRHDDNTAHISGAGIAGLVSAISLAKRGWDVTVFERREEAQEVGAGLYVHENGIRVLESLELLDTVSENGTWIFRDSSYTHDDQLMHSGVTDAEHDDRLLLTPRPWLINVLYREALKSGVRFAFDTNISAIRGRRLVAEGAAGENIPDVVPDLIVGADGVNSKIRKQLGLEKRKIILPTVSVRFLLDGHTFTSPHESRQYWSGTRRMAVVPCGPDHTYVFFSCPEGDLVESKEPGWAQSWSESFPTLRPLFSVLEKENCYIGRYPYLETNGWRKGNVGLLGDAAHALPPTLGQGANLAMVNALSMAALVSRPGISVSESLREWEDRCRKQGVATQRWSYRVDSLTTRWPKGLSWLRNPVVKFMENVPFIRRRLNAASAIRPIDDA